MSVFEINGRHVSAKEWQEFKSKLQKSENIGDVESIFNDNRVTKEEIDGIIDAGESRIDYGNPARVRSANFTGLNELLSKHGFNPESRLPQVVHDTNFSVDSKEDKKRTRVVNISEGGGAQLTAIFDKSPPQKDPKSLRYIYYIDPKTKQRSLAVTAWREETYHHSDLAQQLEIERKDIISAGYWKITPDGNGRIDGMSGNYFSEEATVQAACKFLNGNEDPKFKYTLSVDDHPSKKESS